MLLHKIFGPKLHTKNSSQIHLLDGHKTGTRIKRLILLIMVQKEEAKLPTYYKSRQSSKKAGKLVQTCQHQTKIQVQFRNYLLSLLCLIKKNIR